MGDVEFRHHLKE